MMVDYPYSRENRLCHFCSYRATENEAHLVLECPLYNLIKDKIPSLFEKCTLKEPRVFQVSHQVDITIYLPWVTTLHHYKKTSGLKP